jgi:hypothetical protein
VGVYRGSGRDGMRQVGIFCTGMGLGSIIILLLTASNDKTIPQIAATGIIAALIAIATKL